MPRLAIACSAEKPKSRSRAGMSDAFTVCISAETSRMPVSGRASASSSLKMGRLAPSPRLNSVRRLTVKISRKPAVSPARAAAAGIAATNVSGMPRKP